MMEKSFIPAEVNCSSGYNLKNYLGTHAAIGLNWRPWRGDLNLKRESRNHAKKMKTRETG